VFVDGLRAAVADPKVRGAALEVLSLFKDRPTQELLLKGIEHPKSALVPLHEALRLLSTDVHAGVVDVARRLTKSPRGRKDKAALLQALRILAADPRSIDTLRKVLDSDDYSVDARRMAATAISNLSPAEAVTAVRRVSPAKGRAEPKGALAKHLDTLRRIRQ
jgi:hypothetical protein